MQRKVHMLQHLVMCVLLLAAVLFPLQHWLRAAQLDAAKGTTRLRGAQVGREWRLLPRSTNSASCV